MSEELPPENRQNWGTPPDLMSAIEKRWGKPGFDLAASAENTKAEAFYSEDEDSLVQDWITPKGLDPLVRFCNPQYENIARYAEKCAEVRFLPRWTLLLVPASIDSNWFENYVHNKAFWCGLKGRVKFIGAKHPYMKPLMIAAYGFGVTGCSPWAWRKQ